jgi:hypothetical protein
MNKIIVIICVLLGSASFAQKQAIRIKEQKLGKIIYYVSDSNRLVHVVSPMKVNVHLVEMKDMPESERFALSMSGEQGNAFKSPEIKTLKDRYPGYQFTGDQNSFAVLDCEYKAPGGRELYCDAPPSHATGNYFSVFSVLTRIEGEQLKSQLKANPDGALAALKVKIRHLAPFATSRDELKVDFSRFYESLGGATVSLKGLFLKTSDYLESIEGLRSDADLKTYLIETLVKTCIADPVQTPGLMSLDAFLSTPLKTIKPEAGIQNVVFEKIAWDRVQAESGFDVAYKVVEDKE